jgi:hypothetical protein
MNSPACSAMHSHESGIMAVPSGYIRAQSSLALCSRSNRLRLWNCICVRNIVLYLDEIIPWSMKTTCEASEQLSSGAEILTTIS